MSLPLSSSLSRPLPARLPAAFAPGPWGWPILTALTVGLAIAMRALIPTNEDVSWLIEIAGRTLSGARPYVDYLEVNPPAAIIVYLLPVALGRLLHLAPAVMTDALVMLGAAVSLALAGRILRVAGLLPRAVTGPLLCVAAGLLLVLPSYTFAERDHIAVLALLPGLACLAVRHRGGRPAPAETILAGFGLAIVVAIKPMFVLAILGPAAVLLAGAGWRAVATARELWIGAMVAGLYGFGVLWFVPAFTERVLPMAVLVYVPRRLPVMQLLGSIPRSIWLVALPLLAFLARVTAISSAAWMLASAALGFEAAFLLQGKGFAYQLYPAYGLGLLALATGLIEAFCRLRAAGPPVPGAPRHPFGLSAVFVAACALLGFQTFSAHCDTPRLLPDISARIRALGPHPTMLTISPILALGQPFAHALGATWVGSAPSTWTSSDVQLLAEGGADTTRLTPFVTREQALYADDIVRSRPDAILVQGEQWQAWIESSPALVQAMAGYRPDGPPENTVTLWVPRDAPQALRGALP